MTREEIIDGLEIYTVGRMNKDIVHITVEELQDFIDAIKILEQEPCTDTISREAALKCFTLNNTKADAWNNIKALPPVKPAEKVGQIVAGGYDCEHFVCSKCGQDFGWFSKPNHNYCPNCGAKMQEVEE